MELGIQSVPFFLIDDQYALSGANQLKPLNPFWLKLKKNQQLQHPSLLLMLIAKEILVQFN